MSYLEVKAANPRRSAKRNQLLNNFCHDMKAGMIIKAVYAPQIVPARGLHHLKKYIARLFDGLLSVSYLFSFNDDRNLDYN